MGKWTNLNFKTGNTNNAWLKVNNDECINLHFTSGTPILILWLKISCIEKKWYKLKSSCVFEINNNEINENNNIKIFLLSNFDI